MKTLIVAGWLIPIYLLSPIFALAYIRRKRYESKKKR